jgi:hypothetical protein
MTGIQHTPVARELAPAGPRSGPLGFMIVPSLGNGGCRFGAALQPSGSKLPRHGLWGGFEESGHLETAR